jgi:hypothetical protein
MLLQLSGNGIGGIGYLEIGSQNSDNNFNKITAPVKISVDPDPKAKAMHEGTSDDFFHFYDGPKFDVIFIDGLHHSYQVEKDVINAMGNLHPAGFIVLHDCNPIEEWQQLVPRQHKEWYGDVWRTFVGFRLKYPDVTSFCMDFDCGCGVIKYTDQKIEPGFITDMPWAEFDKNRNALLGMI